MEGDERLIPAEFGLGLNKAFMDLKNISDINVYFNDPINDIGFMSPGVMSAANIMRSWINISIPVEDKAGPLYRWLWDCFSSEDSSYRKARGCGSLQVL